MSKMGKLGLILAALTILCAAPLHAKADPLTFGNVRAVQTSPTDATQNVSTPLFGNSGATLTNGTHVSFFIDVAGTLPPGSTNILRLTFTQADGATIVRDFSIPVFGTAYPPLTIVTALDFPAYYQPTPVSLTVDILGSDPDFVVPFGLNAGQHLNSYTYTFNVVQPVPEPATILLLGTGLTGVLARVRSRRKKRRGDDAS